jgi:hypothetical protein
MTDNLPVASARAFDALELAIPAKPPDIGSGLPGGVRLQTAVDETCVFDATHAGHAWAAMALHIYADP